MSDNPQSAAYTSRIKELESRVLFLESLLALASRPSVMTSAFIAGSEFKCRVYVPSNPIHDVWYGSSMEEALGKALAAEMSPRQPG